MEAPERSMRGLVFCKLCEYWQSFVSQTPISPQLEHKKRRESVCCMCGYRHRFTTRPFTYPNGRKGKCRFVKYPSHIPREMLIDQAWNLNLKLNSKRGGMSSKFKTYSLRKRSGE